MRFGFIKSVIVVALLIAVVIFLPDFMKLFQETTGAKGLSTKKSDELPKQITQDIQIHSNNLKKSVLDVRVRDVITGLSAVSKIPQDLKQGELYVREKLDNVLKSEK